MLHIAKWKPEHRKNVLLWCQPCSCEDHLLRRFPRDYIVISSLVLAVLISLFVLRRNYQDEVRNWVGNRFALKVTELRGTNKGENFVTRGLKKTKQQDGYLADLLIMLAAGGGGVCLWRSRRTPFRDALLNSALGVAVVDQQRKFVAANPEFCRLTGYSESELRSLDWITITHPDDRLPNLALADSMIAGNREGFMVEKRFISKGGDTVWVRNSVSAVRNRRKRGVSNIIVLAEDITEHKRIEAELIKSEDRYRDLVENSEDLICTHDLKGRLLSINPAAARTLGYQTAELLAISLEDIVPRTFRGEFHHYLERIHKQGADKGLMSVTTRSGERRIWEYDNTLRTEGVALPIVRGLARDVTERIRAEKRQRESEERFSKAFHSSVVAFAIVRLHDGLFVDVNDTWQQITGYSREELRGKSTVQLQMISEEVRAKAVAEIQAAGVLRATEVTVRTKRGEYKCLLCSAELITLKKEPHIIWSVSDISAQKKAESALRESEAKFSTAFHSSANAMAISQDGTIVEANQAFVEMFGYSREEMTGKTVADLGIVTEKELDRQLNKLESNRGFVRNEETVVRTRDGSCCDILFSIAPIYLHGVRHLLTTVIDVTERKQAEEDLRLQAERLRCLSGRLLKIREEERTRMARDLHDQIGQMLTAVKLDIEWVAKHLDGGNAQLQARLHSIRELIREATHSVRDICTELRPGVLDDLGLAAAIEWQARDFARRSGLECAVTTRPGSMALDSERSIAIFRIFQEALTNVARHAQATRVDISLVQRDNRLSLVVQDDGKGIGQNELDTKKGSLGILGMRERAQACGAELHIWGEPGKGTTIAVEAVVNDDYPAS